MWRLGLNEVTFNIEHATMHYRLDLDIPAHKVAPSPPTPPRRARRRLRSGVPGALSRPPRGALALAMRMQPLKLARILSELDDLYGVAPAHQTD